MENHPLNLAHQQHRRADAHLLNNRYDEAMQCHHNAAELLLDAMKSTNSSVALESITLQHSYHLKQKDLIKIKKEQYARVKKAMENIKWLGNEPISNLHGHEYNKIQVQIYKAINETDSLLNILSKKAATEQGSAKEIVTKDIVDGKKIEKTPEIVVEELQTLSQNLHFLIEQLVFQVEVLKDENSTLKERVNYLEKERAKYLYLPNDILGSKVIPEHIVSEPTPIVRVPFNRSVSEHISERTNQQPNFDLSAFKD